METVIGQRQRAAVLEAVKGQHFVSLGERGFVPVKKDGDTLSVAEEAQVQSLAEWNGLSYER